MADWKRKNGFVRNLREKLRGFRIFDIKVEHYVEMEESETGLGGTTHVPGKYGVVIITLKGHWRK